MVRSQIKPRLIFWRCVDLLVAERIQVPNYFPLVELILAAINQHKKALASVIENVLTAESRALLDGEPVASKTAAYKLTLLKKLSQSTRPSKVKARAADLALVEELYTSLLPVLNALELSHEGIHYYASSVIKSEIFQMARRADKDRYLHVIAFIAHQYYRLQDNLVDSLLASLQSTRIPRNANIRSSVTPVASSVISQSKVYWLTSMSSCSAR